MEQGDRWRALFRRLRDISCPLCGVRDPKSDNNIVCYRLVTQFSLATFYDPSYDAGSGRESMC